MSFFLNAAVCCSTGYRRRNNEDNFCFDGIILPKENRGQEEPLTLADELNKAYLFGVFDGMGGEQDGETASFMAAEICRAAAGQWQQAGQAETGERRQSGPAGSGLPSASEAPSPSGSRSGCKAPPIPP